MVLYVLKWDLLPEKLKTYEEWIESAIERTVSVPRVIEFRGYRMAVSLMGQIIVTFELKI